MLSVLASPRVSLKNIVVATDFSPASEFALDPAISIARRYESKILLAHAMEPSPQPQPGQEAEMHSREGALADAERKLLAEAQRLPTSSASGACWSPLHWGLSIRSWRSTILI